MRRLDGEIGCPLFKQVGRAIEPTAAARYLASNTQGVRQRLNSLRDEVASIASGKHGHVRLGVSATMASIYLPALVRRLTSEIPDLRLTFINGMNDVLRHALRSGELDMVLGVFDLTPNNYFDGHTVRQQIRITGARSALKHLLINDKPPLLGMAPVLTGSGAPQATKMGPQIIGKFLSPATEMSHRQSSPSSR